jgi:hypothetical protein
MRLTARRLVFVLVVFALPGIAARSGQREVIEITLKGGKVHAPAEVSGGLPVIRVRRGQDVVLRWRSDLAMTLHLHGYDVETRVQPQGAATIAFVARAAGRFPVERHGNDGHMTLLYIEVRP